jgi:hypothetical protein
VIRALLACALALGACTKARTADPPPAGSAQPVAAVDAGARSGAAADAGSATDPASSDPRGAVAVRDPVPVTPDSRPAADLAKQIGGSGQPARGGRSLVVLKSKTALDRSSLDAGKVMLEYVKHGQASVKTCFEQLRAKDPAATGTLTLRFAVDVKGAVVDADVEGWNADVAACVRSAMAAWVFAAPDKQTRFVLVVELVIG